MIQLHKLINKEQSQLSLASSLLLILQVNQGPHKWTPNQDIAKGLQHIGQHNLLCEALASWTTFSPHLSTYKDHYILKLQVLPSHQRSLHSGLTYGRELSKKNYNLSSLKILHVQMTGFASPFYFYLLHYIHFGLLFSKTRTFSDVIYCLVFQAILAIIVNPNQWPHYFSNLKFLSSFSQTFVVVLKTEFPHKKRTCISNMNKMLLITAKCCIENMEK